MIFVHDESIPKKKAFSRRASKSFGEAAGKGSGDGSRYAADREPSGAIP